MPLPGFPYATIVGFGVLVVAAGLYMLFANQQQVPIGYGSSNRRRRSVSPPPTGGSWNRPSARDPSRNRTHVGFSSGGSEYKSDPSDKPKHAGYRCIICLDCEEHSRFVKISCGHHYHVNCLKKWFEVSQRGKVCPSCNAIAASQ